MTKFRFAHVIAKRTTHDRALLVLIRLQMAYQKKRSAILDTVPDVVPVCSVGGAVAVRWRCGVMRRCSRWLIASWSTNVKLIVLFVCYVFVTCVKQAGVRHVPDGETSANCVKPMLDPSVPPRYVLLTTACYCYRALTHGLIPGADHQHPRTKRNTANHTNYSPDCTASQLAWLVHRYRPPAPVMVCERIWEHAYV